MFVLCTGNSYINRLGAGGFQLGLGLLHFHVGSNASCIAALDQFRGLLVLGYRGIQKLLFRIEHASLEIVQSELRVQGQVHGSQIGGTSLRLVAIRFNGATHASPDIDLVGEFERNLKIVVGDAVEG